ncbi:hypothetical protein [Sphaerimonospora mesophila]|uniref:hypothetical protein n=1 Tax=Sphaerimonospora mesophila TaxID=37483 RepID=UPI000A802538
MSKLPDGLEPIDPLTWRTIVARCLLGSTVKLVALTLANYASPNGADVRPGEKLLGKDTELGERTIRDALRKLREVGLIYRVFEASAMGLADLADEYQLTFPNDLESRIPMWDPKRKKITKGGVEQAPPTPHRRKRTPKAPATDAGGPAVDNSPPPATPAGGFTPENHHETDAPEGLPEGNHRQLITEPPATHNQTTGRSCRPPSHTPSQSPSHNSGTSPYGAEVEGKTAERREPSAEDSPITLPSPGPGRVDYASARDALAQLPDLGSALIDQARAELGDTTSITRLVIHAATLARSPR